MRPYMPDTESTPQRMRVSGSWEFGECKRCLTASVKTGDVVVKIKGRGWWHDACYRIVNPRFYDGMTGDPTPTPPTPQTLPDVLL